MQRCLATTSSGCVTVLNNGVKWQCGTVAGQWRDCCDDRGCVMATRPVCPVCHISDGVSDVHSCLGCNIPMHAWCGSCSCGKDWQGGGCCLRRYCTTCQPMRAAKRPVRRSTVMAKQPIKRLFDEDEDDYDDESAGDPDFMEDGAPSNDEDAGSDMEIDVLDHEPEYSERKKGWIWSK